MWPRLRLLSVGNMSISGVEKIAGGAAVTGAVAQLVATVLEPDWGGDDVAGVARVVAGTKLWNADRVLDLVGTLLAVAALNVVDRRLVRSGSEWPRLAQPFLFLVAAFGGVAVAGGAAIQTMATSWQHADPQLSAAYLASFDSVRRITEDVFAAAFLALGLYLVLLSASVLTTSAFAHWVGWCAGAAGILVVTGDLLSIRVDAAFLLVLVGFALFLVVVFVLGLSLWRNAAREPVAPGHRP